MANKNKKAREDDALVLIRKDGKLYSLQPKPGVSQEWARKKRILISGLFLDQHTLKPATASDIKELQK